VEPEALEQTPGDRRRRTGSPETLDSDPTAAVALVRIAEEAGQRTSPLLPRRGGDERVSEETLLLFDCLLYTSPSPRDLSTSRMPSSA